MSVFRNPRPGDKEAEPNRFGEASLSRPESGDLLQNIPPLEPVESPRSSFPSFAERESPRAPAESRGPTSADKCANVIAAGSRWSGNLNIEDSVRIEGNVTGEITAKGTVHIAESAHVEAKIRAGFIVISGTFKGELRCDERLELMPKSRVQGQMVTKTLNVHEGAMVDGSMQMSGEPPAAPQRNREAARDTVKA
jgi:cytoskeletal protein CcmA (bactofilin family)